MNEEKSLKGKRFPSDETPEHEKRELEFGLKIGEAIEAEWFGSRAGAIKRFNERNAVFETNRLYSRGKQPISKYKTRMAVNGDLSYLNLDWTPLAIMPKFIDLIVNGMSARMFKIQATAEDSASVKARDKRRRNIKGQMVAKPVLEIIQEKSGVNPFTMPPDELPSNDEELSLYLQLKDKTAIEIAEETAISSIFKDNKDEQIKRGILTNIAEIGIAIASHEFSEDAGVRLYNEDPAQMVWSYTEEENFSDVFYWGKFKSVHTSELHNYKRDLTEEELEQIKQSSGAWYTATGLSDEYYDNAIDGEIVPLLFFSYKTTRKDFYKRKMTKNGREVVSKKDYDFDPDEEMMQKGNFSKDEKEYEVWYEGIKVLGTDIMLKWEVEENMVRPAAASYKAMPKYIAYAPGMYKGSFAPISERMIPLVDQIQMTHLRLQTVVNRMVPDGIFLDADGVTNVNLGNGKAYNPSKALEMYFQTGSVVGRSYTTEGDMNAAKVPIQQIATGSGSAKIQSLLANYNMHMDMLRSVIGANDASDASTPNPRSLVGVQKIAALNSNTATRHILDSMLYIMGDLATATSLRISDILQYSDFKEEFINKIGKDNVGILEDMKDLPACSFGIHLALEPDSEEQAFLDSRIEKALDKGDINLEDAIEIQEIKNLKLSMQSLKVKRIKRLEDERQNEAQKQAIAAQANNQSQAIAAKAAMDKINAEKEAKIEILTAEKMLEIKVMEREKELKDELMQSEYDKRVALETQKAETQMGTDMKKEEEKNRRIDKQSTNTSKLIEQKAKDLPPMNFESNEDTLDGFSLKDYNPTF